MSAMSAVEKCRQRRRLAGLVARCSMPGRAGSWSRRWARRLWFPASIVFLHLYSFPYFAGIHSANELPRIYLTMAIVDHRTFAIDDGIRRYGSTVDESARAGHSYSNKAPGMSFLGVPAYAALRAFHRLRGTEPSLREIFYWLRLTAAALPALLFLPLLWRFLRHPLPDTAPRRSLLAAYALGSMALPYGMLLISHQLSAVFLGAAYILVAGETIGGGERPPRPPLAAGNAVLAGLCAGLALLADYQVAFAFVPLGTYLLWHSLRARLPIRAASLDATVAAVAAARPTIAARLRPPLLFGLGFLPPLALLLAYHHACFGSPFRTGYDFPTFPLFQQFHKQGFLGLSRFRWSSFAGSFFAPDNGLFVFSPFWLLALPGFILMLRSRRWRADGILCLGIVLFYAYFVSSLTFWRGGWTLGPRYITCALPFLLLPAALTLGWAWSRPRWRAVALALVLASIGFHLLACASFPQYPEVFRNPFYEVTLRLLGDNRVPYNLGWALGLRGLTSLIPYLVVAIALVLALAVLAGGPPRLSGVGRRRLLPGALAVVLAITILGAYSAFPRSGAAGDKLYSWMLDIWEPRKAVSRGDGRSGS